MNIFWPAAAFILSLIAPGGGQILNGDYLKGLIFALIFVFGRYVLLPLALRILRFKDDSKSLRLIYVFNIIYPVIMIISAVDACWRAFHAAYSVRAALFAVASAFIIAAMYKGMGARFIVYAMLGQPRENLLPYILPAKKSK